MKAMILAAGFGTRLRPLTLEKPKPLVPLLGKPLIEHTIRFLKSHGISEVVINLHHHAKAIPRALGDGSSLGVSIHYIEERGEIRGTGGGLLGARSFLDGGTSILVNGDIVLEPDLEAAIELHKRNGALATMVLRSDPNAQSYGALGVDKNGYVRTLLGTPSWQGPLRTTMFTGLHIVEPGVFDLLPEKGCIVRSVYRRLIDQGDQKVAGHVDQGPWFELGTVRDYLDTNLALVAKDATLSHVSVGTNEAMWVHPTAHIASADLLKAPVVVGARAVIKAPVHRAVVWPDAVVTAPVSDAVVTARTIARVNDDSSS